MESITMFQKCQIDKYIYRRMQNLNEDDPFYQEKSYEQFIEWNNECFVKLSVDERNWVLKLCDLINTDSFKLLEEECCGELQPSCVFFNKDCKICVVHPS